MKKEFISYLITDPAYYTNNPKEFKKFFVDVLKKHKVDFACFRDKISPNKEKLATIFVATCKEFGIKKSLINNDIDLAIKLNATGVHLNSNQFDQIQKAKEQELYVIISCHSFEEIQKAKDCKADAVTLSPIFSTPNKGEPKGVDFLNNATNNFDITIIALGGIVSDKDVESIKKTNSGGFASIRYFCDF